MTRQSQFPSDPSPSNDDETKPPEESGGLAGLPKQTPESSAEQDDLLAEARRALIEEQSQSESKFGVFKKLRKSRQSQKAKETSQPGTPIPEPAPQPQPEEASLEKQLAAMAEEETISPEEKQLEAETQAILESLEHAETGLTVAPQEGETLPAPAEKATAPEKPQAIENVIETAHQVLKSKPENDTTVDLPELRDIALEGYEEPTPEEVAPPRPTLDDTLEQISERIRYRTLIRITILSLVLVIFLAIFLGGTYLKQNNPTLFQPRPTITPTVVIPTQETPIPVQVRLPGGWAFVLDKSGIVNGAWNPAGPEWLEGTEICRWVSLPWSEQLEAVFKTMKKGDRLELVMTNYDHWLYRVQSVEEVPVSKMTSLDKNYPSLLLMLTKQDSDIRLVILAVP